MLESADFPQVEGGIYRQKKDSEHEEVFKIHDLKLEDAKKVSFSVIKRYREYFQKCFESEEGR